VHFGSPFENVEIRSDSPFDERLTVPSTRLRTRDCIASSP
jgi:hypothetical protein